MVTKGSADAHAVELAVVFRALANPTRLAILSWLRDPSSFPEQDIPAEKSGVCLKHIQARAGLSQSTASQFMAILERAGLVTSERHGKWTHWKRDERRIAELGSTVATGL